MIEHVGLCVVGTWNSTGHMFVLVDQESAYALTDAYEKHRLKHNLPWITVKEAVDGHGILENVKNGIFPWVVAFRVGRIAEVQNVKAVPLQHCVKVPDVEMGPDDRVTRATVWAADEFEAANRGVERWCLEHGVDPKSLQVTVNTGEVDFYTEGT